jgi:hypothetical protein
MKQFKIVDWANNDVNTCGETFDTFDDAWTWIYEFIDDETQYDDLFVVEL